MEDKIIADANTNINMGKVANFMRFTFPSFPTENVGIQVINQEIL